MSFLIVHADAICLQIFIAQQKKKKKILLLPYFNFALALTYNVKKKYMHPQTAKKFPIACTLKSLQYIALVLQSDPLGQTQL